MYLFNRSHVHLPHTGCTFSAPVGCASKRCCVISVRVQFLSKCNYKGEAFCPDDFEEGSCCGRTFLELESPKFLELGASSEIQLGTSSDASEFIGPALNVHVDDALS